jgi:7-cyano-7-deazaguanine reductase
MSSLNKKNSSKLGKTVQYQYLNPDIKILDKVSNPHLDVDYVISFACPEFTSICPVTGQPDFAHIVIDYIPSKQIVESKSLKLYLHSFRNHGAFHEDCTIKIAKDLQKLLNPKWLRIGGYWYPRGGIPIDIFYQTSIPPKNVWIKEQNVPNYKGRG